MKLPNPRHELKYTISPIDYHVLRKRLDLFFDKDEHTKSDGYIVTSIYFDDTKNTNLYQKINGESHRYKYRIRYYDDSQTLFKLEKKSKSESITYKESYVLTRDEVKKIIGNDSTFLLKKDSRVCHEFYQGIKNNLLKPKVVVRYHRVAYTHKAGNTRITFDTNIQTSLHSYDFLHISPLYVPQFENIIVMEIKFNNTYPYILRSLLQTTNSMQSSMSKYVYSRTHNNYI